MEDYKQKYEQALENIKKIKAANKDNKELVDFIEYKYPELKECEDKKIKEDIISLVNEFWERIGSINLEYSSRSKMLAWLEKQGEIKRSDYPYVTGWRENRPDNKPKIKHSILMLTTHGVAEGEWLGEEWCQYRWSCKVKDEDVLYWLHLSDLETLEKENVKRDFFWLEKQGEQKLADKIEPKFHEGDKLVSTKNPRLTYKVLEIGNINELGNPEYKVEIFTDGKAKNPRNIHYIECYKVEEWAKLIEQKSAWSEEDEQMIDDIIEAIDKQYAVSDYQEMVNWLKSLKERYTWKPSDEQIIELHQAISGCSYNIEPLIEIEEHLKKLKEE